MERYLSPYGAYAPLVLRLVLGVIFFAHGAQKLFGWFGGGGFADTAQGFEGLLPIPGTISAIMGGGGEFFGAILILLGFFTRVGGFLIASTMVIAVAVVHWSNGLFAENGGFEYPLLCLAAAVSLMLSGGGALSIDSKLKKGSCESGMHSGTACSVG